MSRGAARERLLHGAKSAIDAHLDGCERLARQRGFDVRERHWQMDHVRWLVDHQVNGQSKSAIATAEGLPRKTVSDGVNSAARLLGIRLRRPSKGGRPRGARDTRPRHVVRR